MISTGRCCRACGTDQVRWFEGKRERTNLNPITGECVDCTAKRSREVPREQRLEFDPKMAQIPSEDR